MKLLIVEDDEDASSFMQYVLEDERHSVRTASACGEARLQLKDFVPDVIILDRGLPDQDGLEFCKELKKHPRTAAIPVMFVSSAKSPAEIADGFSAGGADYVTKPFSFVELVARVTALGRRSPPPATA
jgi:two-component system phosphate regulon response regulator PhoB